MRVLFSAFECRPASGSDAYVGWSWAKEMSRLCDVHVLTSEDNCESIQAWLKMYPNQVKFHYVPLPAWIKKLLKGRKGYFVGYCLWQWAAYCYSKKLITKEKFDVIHHVSIADFRENGYLWKLGIPFVYGPVGGGQETPRSLRYYVRNHRKNETFRSVLNCISMLRPSYRQGIAKAEAVFVSNDETIAMMRKYFGNKVKLEQMCELGVDQTYLDERKDLVHHEQEKVHILVSGRMMYRKGIELLLDACEYLKTEVPYVIDLYGGGHQEEMVRKQIDERGLCDRVLLHGKIPYERMQEMYAKGDIYVLPSLRETTGTAVVEAMANKLPVIALKQNGVKYLVGDNAGILATIGSREETVRNLAEALRSLIESRTLRIAMGEQGYEVLKEHYSWESKARDMYGRYLSYIKKNY